jgi:glycosyltransferase involved in cell wall biosynthesis
VPGPLVSVVIPFLDPPVEFFRQAIESVLAQDYRPAELILVNDGSREAAVAVARRMADGDDMPVRYVEHRGGENRGSSASRNLGVSVAAGEYVAFLDADDVWVPGKLAEQVAYLQKRPQTAMVFGQTRYWYSWRDSAAGDFVVSRGVERETAFQPPDFVPRFLRGRVIWAGKRISGTTPCASCARRQPVLQSAGRPCCTMPANRSRAVSARRERCIFLATSASGRI